ncbi:MAG: domain S-box, partial [candidate division NC10 bacterium]|nr:domain S-box [candidate division NC10 bacterium]
MRPALSCSAVLFCLLLATATASLAEENRITPMTTARSTIPEAEIVVGFLAASLLALTLYFALTARRVAKKAGADNRDLKQQIAELKRAGETLSRLASIVESSDDAIIGKTLDGIIVSWNPGAERIYGYAQEEMIGQPISVLVPPDHPDEVIQILEKVNRGERVDHFETVRMRKDGRRIDVSLTVSPIKDATGQITGASTITRDITDRKRAAEALRHSEERYLEALRHSEERYRDLVENSEALIYTHDPEGKLLSVNRAMVRHLGYSFAEELLGRKLSEFVASDVLHLFDAYLNTVMKDGHTEGFMKLLTRGGEERFFEYRNSLRAEGLAKPIVHGIAHDVTERMQAEMALAKRTRRMQTLRT